MGAPAVQDVTKKSRPRSEILSKSSSQQEEYHPDDPTHISENQTFVWAGIAQSRPTVSLPAAEDFCQMLRKTWEIPSKPCQFNVGCRKLARGAYPPRTGLGDMPPVEREMAALTSTGPPRLTADPHCPRRECDRTDRLVCKAYNASARAARSGNALAVLLAAVR